MSTSKRSWPCAAWTVMTMYSILRIEESLDEEAGGSTIAIGSTNSSIVGSPEVWGLDAPIEDSTLGCLKLAFNWAALCRRKVAPIGAMICMGSNAGKSLNLNLNESYE